MVLLSSNVVKIVLIICQLWSQCIGFTQSSWQTRNRHAALIKLSSSKSALEEVLELAVQKEGLEGNGNMARTESMRRKQLVVPESSVLLTSMSPAVNTQPHIYTDEGDEIFGGGVDAEEDYLDDKIMEEELAAESLVPQQRRPPPIKITRKFLGMRFTKTPNYGLKEMIADKNYNAMVTKLCIPIAILSVGAVWTARKAGDKYNTKMEDTLEQYANEMVYHDGDFDEMNMCHAEYKKRLSSFGLKRNDKMIKRYLEIFAKKKPVSPQALSSLSRVFTMYKLTEHQAANVLVEVSTSLKDKLASAGKLLFFGEHILKSPEGLVALQPIRVMLSSKYRAGGEFIVENAQKTMAEAAYRATLIAAADIFKQQENYDLSQMPLSTGWEVLGLTKEKARSIFDELAEKDFISAREQIYGGARQKFNAKGKKVDSDGKLTDEKDKEEAGSEEESSTEGASNVFECGECGFTLFVAQGREFKFFPDSYRCPECDAPKDKFLDGTKIE